MKRLATPQEVVDALGGRRAVQELTGMSGDNLSQSLRPRGRGVFPSKTYVAMTRALERQGMIAPPELWQMVA
jgi:hypothetical protein